MLLVLAMVAGGCATARPVAMGYSPLELAQLRTIEAERQQVLQSGSYRLCSEVTKTGKMSLAVDNDVWVSIPTIDAPENVGAICRDRMPSLEVELARFDERRADVEGHRAVREVDARVATEEERRRSTAAVGAALRAVGDSFTGRNRTHLNCVSTGPGTSVCNGN